MNNSQPLTIGRLAKTAGVNVETVRYYQRLNLLVEPEKPLNGFRVYLNSDIARIKFIKRAQQLGFTLKEIMELLNLGEGRCQEVQVLAQQKLDKIEAHMTDLKSMHKVLNALLTQCKLDKDPNIHCAIIDCLTIQ